ncbi:MAG: aminoglycoside phosphotransferase family protein [Ferruginibacter sp.]
MEPSPDIIKNVLHAFGLENVNTILQPVKNGLIHKTWKLTNSGMDFILQQVNDSIFKNPQNIVHNTRLIAAFLQNESDYKFVAPLPSNNGQELVHVEGYGFYRLFPFVTGSHSKDTVDTAAQAYEAAVQFGRFTKLTAGIHISDLKITIPHFHDLELRYEQFVFALHNGNKIRITETADLIKILIGFKEIVNIFHNIQQNRGFKLRVTHHDTKISNVLFNDGDKGLCVIDLDTVMPGYFISDVGDMIRTYVCPVNEDEHDHSKICIRTEVFTAIVKGYYGEMKSELTDVEKSYFLFAGKFMIYMQALRFLTDYLQDDIYYTIKYPAHNLTRAINQTILLQELEKRKEELEQLSFN